MYRHKKSPTYIEQLNRLLHEVDYYHFLNTANIRTIFQPCNSFVKFFKLFKTFVYNMPIYDYIYHITKVYQNEIFL